MEGANPCKQHAADLREPTKTLQKIIPWHQKSKPSRKLRPKGTFFWTTSGAATPQPSGSNPDRSPTAQWLNMRISLASRLPAAGSQLPAPGSRLPAPGCRLPAPSSQGCASQLLASRGPVKTLSGPARRWRQAPAAGKVVRNQHRGRNFASIQNSCAAARPGAGGKPRRRGRFSEFKISREGPEIRLQSKLLPGPALAASTGGGEGFQKS